MAEVLAYVSLRRYAPLTDNGTVGRADEDVYVDDESAEVVIASLRLGDDQGSLFTNTNWFTFRDEKIDNSSVSTSLSEVMEDINLNGTVNGGNGSDDEVVVDEYEELAETKDADNIFSSSNSNDASGVGISGDESKGGKVDALGEAASIQFDSLDNKDSIGEMLVSDWARWGNISGLQVDGSGTNPFLDHEAVAPSTNPFNVESTLPNGSSTVDDAKNQ